jgi:hypothetical protein
MNNIDLRLLTDILQWAILGVLSFVNFVRKPGEQAVREISDLRERVVRIEANFDAVREDQKSIKLSLHRIEDFLMNNKPRD